jgi:transcriptional regulator with XRE-family HTH domain
MGAKEFGELISDRMEELGLSQNRLGARIGELPDGRFFDATQIRMLREGRRRLDQMLVERIIQVLGLDTDPATELKAWRTAGLWPPYLEPEDLGDISDQLAARRMTAASRAASREGAAASASPSPADQRKPTTAYFGVLREDEEEAAA